MSKKKNKNRQQNLLQDSSENENSVSSSKNEPVSNEAGKINISNSRLGLFAYLKAHWWAVALVAFLAIGALGGTLKYLEDNARQNAANGKNQTGENEPSLLSKLNPFAPAAMTSPSPTPLPLSKEYIYAGSRLLAVEDANANAAPPADLAVWRPSTGVWWVMGGQGSSQVTQTWGASGDKPVPGDYDGDGKTDFSIFRPDTTAQTGTWYVLYSSTSSWTATQWGMHNDEIAPADYDGDGKTDIALWRPSTGAWYILKSSDNQSLSFQYGSSGDKPSPADYDGDGKADVALWRSSNSTFYSINSSNAASQSVTFSQTSTEPVCADYDGDGKADFAVRNGGGWSIRSSSVSTTQTITPSWQQSGDVSVHNDYDGDGKVDVAVWRPSSGNWYIRQSSLIGQSNELRQVQWGQSGDTPVPAFYRR